jgi:hypothetical protein
MISFDQKHATYQHHKKLNKKEVKRIESQCATKKEIRARLRRIYPTSIKSRSVKFLKEYRP